MSVAPTITGRTAALLARIHDAERAAGRPSGSVTLIGAAKTHSADAVREAHGAGLRHVGENYLSEAVQRQAALTDLGLVWHFIGPVQSNKTREIAARFDWVHGVDREKIARRLSDARPADRPPLNLCIQVNLDAEPTKTGVAPNDLAALLESVRSLPRVRLVGLMALPAPRSEPEDQQAPFEHLRALLADAVRICPEMDTLSMGMSADMEAAIAQGATHVRIGTALFGRRSERSQQ